MLKESGITLLELLIAVAVASLLLSAGVPGFRNVILDNRLVSQTNEFVTAVSLARSSAVRFQRNATVCASTNFNATVPTCAAGTDWSTGWIVWVDKDRDGATDANEVIAVNGPLSDSTTFSSTAVSSFTYDALGFGVTAGDALTLCDGRSNETGRVINVNNVGRTSVARQVCTG